MQLNALDANQMLALMVAGALFALAGLWLMFRPKPEGGAAKLELFGMKFEASSAGFLVFLVGAAFFASPLVVPRNDSARSPQDSQGTALRQGVGTTPDRSGGTIVLTSPEGTTAGDTSELGGGQGSPPPPVFDGPEGESQFSSARELSVGRGASGQLEYGEVAYFSFDVPVGMQGQVVVSAVSSGKDDITLTLFDTFGMVKGVQRTIGEDGKVAVSIATDIEGSTYYALISAVPNSVYPPGTDATYHISFGAGRRLGQ